MKSPRNVLILDYGGVVGDHHQPLAEKKLCDILSVDNLRLRTLLSEKSEHGRHVRESRITQEEFWLIVAELAGVPKSKLPSISELDRLWAETYKFNNLLYETLKIVRNQSLIGLLTNMDSGRSDALRTNESIELKFDYYFASYMCMKTKPSCEIFNMARKNIEENHPSVRKYFYVDDRVEHVDAAESHGWVSFLYTGIQNLRSDLTLNGLL